MSLRMLFRKKGTASAVLALGLLVAIIASMNSVLNCVNAQSEALASLVQIGETYLIVSLNATSITDSRIDAELANRVLDVAEVNQAFLQKVFTANLEADSVFQTAKLRAVENVEGFLAFRGARLNGTFAQNWTEANVGELLARTANITLDQTITISSGKKAVEARAAGIFRTQTELDAEIVIPMGGLNNVFAVDDQMSIIEFTLKAGVDKEKALNNIAINLPESVEIVKVQQPSVFMQTVNMQTLTFLNVWSVAVYAVIVAASYVITARLTAESAYELAMLKALGARKRQILTLIVGCVAATAVLASILGTALGVTAAQIASTILRWLRPTIEIAPFLQAEQALKAIALTLASAVLGSAVPAVRAARLGYVEQPL